MRPCAALDLRNEHRGQPANRANSATCSKVCRPASIAISPARPRRAKALLTTSTCCNHLAQQYNLDWKPQSLADHTTITTTGTRLASDDIRPYVIDKVKDQGIRGDIDVQFDNHALEITVPSDRAPNMVLNNFSYDPINKRFHADLIADGFAGPVSAALTGHIIVSHTYAGSGTSA